MTNENADLMGLWVCPAFLREGCKLNVPRKLNATLGENPRHQVFAQF